MCNIYTLLQAFKQGLDEPYEYCRIFVDELVKLKNDNITWRFLTSLTVKICKTIHLLSITIDQNLFNNKLLLNNNILAIEGISFYYNLISPTNI